MLIAEALAARKDLLKAINEAPARLADAAVRFEDEDAAAKQTELTTLEGQLERNLDEYQRLTVAINRTNNATSLLLEGEQMSLMQAIALRDRLVLAEKRQREALESIDEALGSGSRARRYGGLERRSKDDIRRLPVSDLHTRRLGYNQLAKRIRTIDLDIQKVNWSTELVG